MGWHVGRVDGFDVNIHFVNLSIDLLLISLENTNSCLLHFQKVYFNYTVWQINSHTHTKRHYNKPPLLATLYSLSVTVFDLTGHGLASHFAIVLQYAGP
jgi:hypothetical protein